MMGERCLVHLRAQVVSWLDHEEMESLAYLNSISREERKLVSIAIYSMIEGIPVPEDLRKTVGQFAQLGFWQMLLKRDGETIKEIMGNAN